MSFVLKSASFAQAYRSEILPKAHVRSVCHQSFPHLWKKLWKFPAKGSFEGQSNSAALQNLQFSPRRKFDENVQF